MMIALATAWCADEQARTAGPASGPGSARDDFLVAGLAANYYLTRFPKLFKSGKERVAFMKPIAAF